MSCETNVAGEVALSQEKRTLLRSQARVLSIAPMEQGYLIIRKSEIRSNKVVGQ